MSIVQFILGMIVMAAVLTGAALFVERAARRGEKRPVLTTKTVVMAGLFSAISGVLMFFDIPVAFAPSFYKLDISEVPVLVLSFAYGPAAAVLCQLGKILIKLLLKGTTSAFVGEAANFVIGCFLVVPAGAVYLFQKTKKGAILGCVLGTILMTALGSLINVFYLLPMFSEIYGMPLQKIVEMGQLINPSIRNVGTLVLFCVVPLNLVKGALDSVITVLLYKRLSPMLKNK